MTGGSVGARHDLPCHADEYSGRFRSAKTESVIAKPNFHRIAQGCEPKDLDLIALQQSHFEEPLAEGIVTVDRIDAGSLSGSELV
jgi:hypothetical protein